MLEKFNSFDILKGMSCNATEIGDVVGILGRDLRGAIVRQVFSPATPDRIVIELRGNRKNHYLQFVLAPTSSRVCRIPGKPSISKEPHPFVMLLRKELKGMLIDSISQVNRDRVVRVEAVTKERRGSLVVELTSRHANMFWLGSDGKITGSFSVNRSHKRKLVPGLPYVPPIPHDGSKSEDISRFDAGDDLEEEIETHYKSIEKELELRSERDRLKRVFKKASKRLKRLKKNLEGDRERAAQGERLAHFGHLLKANLHLAKKGLTDLEVNDFEGQKAVIPLDPRLKPVANMERLFSKSKRLMGAVNRIEKRQAEVAQLSDAIAKFAGEIDTSDFGSLVQIEKEIQKHFPGLVKRSSRRRALKQERIPFREYPISAGRIARVGRSAKDNDTLTLRFAKPDDLWLHVRGRTGSHIVVPMGRGEDPTEAILVDAAHLAAHFSDAKGDTDVEVIYTRRRYVQKPKGAAPGSVRLLKEKTINLRMETSRLEGILK